MNRNNFYSVGADAHQLDELKDISDKQDVIIRLLQGKPPYPNPPKGNWMDYIPTIRKRLEHPDPNAPITQLEIEQIIREMNEHLGGD